MNLLLISIDFCQYRFSIFTVLETIILEIYTGHLIYRAVTRDIPGSQYEKKNCPACRE